ncbi:MAG: dipeptidase [Lachnospiraceae bacterium]|nr:dipeptidase [Lachnospiraceae bacterium]
MRVIDMHCDTIAELLKDHEEGGTKSIRDCGLHVTLDKMEAGGYGLQNFALYTRLDSTKGRPFEHCIRLADTFFTEMRANEDKIGIVKSYEDIEKNWSEGKLSALLTVEEGGVCQGKLSYLRILYELGARMMTLTWNFQNELAWPNATKEIAPGEEIVVPDTVHGLTETGIAFVEEMERLGMVVDISHLNDAGIWDVFRYSKKPFVASHSNCRSLSSHPRNLTDEMLKALAERGGVAGINFCAAFLREDDSKEEGCSYLKDMIRHMKHMKQVGGIGVIGLGTDFDGISNEVEVADASQMQRLAEEMEREGFTIGEIEAVFHKNVLRVYKEIL